LGKQTKVEEVNALLDRLVILRRKSAKSKSAKVHKAYEDIQQEAAKKLDYLVEARARKYRAFSNYDDLCQDGRLALFRALQTYSPEKGDFFWWANKYIKTKISREANRHSTIKIPLKHTKHIQPYKVSQLPIIVDNEPDAFENITKDETNTLIRSAVSKLPNDQRRVIELHFEMSGSRREAHSIGKICEKLKITRVNCVKLLNEAKKNLKQELTVLGT